MSTVRSILSSKGPQIHTISPAATGLDAVRKMNDLKIGCLLVVQSGDSGSVAGIVTERDVLRKIVAQERRPREMQVADIMTRDVICCRINTPLEDARSIMKVHKVRHLPVLDESDKLAGLISIGDLNAELVREDEVTIEYLHQYIYGRV